MKRIILTHKIVLSVFVLLSAFSYLSNAQNRPNKLNFNVQTNYFIAKKDHQGSSFNSINPGGEILYEWEFNKSFSLLTGTEYIYSTWNYSMGSGSYFKIIAHEIFIPVILNDKLSKKINLALGIYSGRLVYVKSLYTDNIISRHWINNTKHTDYYSSQKFSADLFMETGFTESINRNQSIKFAPYIKYKLTDNWMVDYRSRVTIGVKINLEIEL